MSRAVAPSLVWENDDGADRAGSFTVRLESPHQWRLEDGGTTVGTYPTNITARNAAVELHRRRAIRRRLRRHRVIGSVSLLVRAGLEPAHRAQSGLPPARAQADRLDAARHAVEGGDLTIEQVGSTYEGLTGGSFEFLGRSGLGLAGTLAGDCYGLVWRPGFEPSGYAVRTNYVTCSPDANLINQPDPPV